MVSEVELLWEDADMASFGLLSCHEGNEKKYENHATSWGLNLWSHRYQVLTCFFLLLNYWKHKLNNLAVGVSLDSNRQETLGLSSFYWVVLSNNMTDVCGWVGQQLLSAEVCASSLTEGRQWESVNTLRTGLLNCLNARFQGLTFRRRASCI